MAVEELDSLFVTRWMDELNRLAVENEAWLTELDAAIGDADHGANMTRGLRASVAALTDSQFATPRDALAELGRVLTLAIGGASGPLFGAVFLEMSAALPDKPTIGPEELATGLRGGLRGVQRLGAAELGDKTMIDAIAPAVTRIEESIAAGDSLAEAISAGAAAANAGARDTVPLMARKGRASYLGARSEGHQDPGATSAALLFDALVVAIKQ